MEYGMVSLVAVLFGSIVSGGLVGLIPFFVGKKKNQERIGLIGLLVCMLASIVAGLYLSIPACLITVIIILVKEGKNR